MHEARNKNGFAIKAVSLLARAAARGLTAVIYRGQKSSDESDIIPRCSNGAGVDNLTAFCGDQGMVNDHDRRTGRSFKGLSSSPCSKSSSETIQPPIQVNRYLMNVCSKVQNLKEPPSRRRQ
ncbi:Uncharacterized protein DBV15_11095, partial [Temnothorax longispinosus]